MTNNESYTTGQKFGVGKIRIYLFKSLMLSIGCIYFIKNKEQ